MIESITAWLTPVEHRRLLYKVAALIGTVLVAHGLLTSSDVADYLVDVGLLLGVAAPVVAHKNAKGK